MRQDRPGQLLEAGSVYVLRSAGFRRARHRFFGRIVPYRVPAERVFEIDEPADLAYAGHALSARTRG
jgi:CMP-N-acetylneuraminic acid synthetase